MFTEVGIVALLSFIRAISVVFPPISIIILSLVPTWFNCPDCFKYKNPATPSGNTWTLLIILVIGILFHVILNVLPCNIFINSILTNLSLNCIIGNPIAKSIISSLVDLHIAAIIKGI